MATAKIIFRDLAREFTSETEPERHRLYAGLYELARKLEAVERLLTQVDQKVRSLR